MKFTVALGVLTLVTLTTAGASMHNAFFCYATDTIRSMTNMASIVTSYEAVRRFNFTTVSPDVSSKSFTSYFKIATEKIIQTYSACSPSKFWYFGRHGNILPGLQLLDNMLNFARSSVS